MVRALYRAVVAALLLFGCAHESVSPRPTRSLPNDILAAPYPASHDVAAPAPPLVVSPPSALERRRRTLERRARAVAGQDRASLQLTYGDTAAFVHVDAPSTFAGAFPDASAILPASAAGERLWAADAGGVALGRAWAKDDVVIHEWVGSDGRMAGLSLLSFDPDGRVRAEYAFYESPQLRLTEWPKGAAASALTLRTSTSASEDASHASIVDGMYRALNTKDEAALTAALAPDVHRVSFLGNSDDLSGARASFRSLMKTVPDLSYRVYNEWAVDNDVIVEYALSGTPRAPFLDRKPTGQPIHLHAVDVIELAGGKIQRIETHANAYALRAQLDRRPTTITTQGASCSVDGDCSAGLRCGCPANVACNLVGISYVSHTCVPDPRSPLRPLRPEELDVFVRSRAAGVRRACFGGTQVANLSVRFMIAPSGEVSADALSESLALNRCVECVALGWEMRRSAAGLAVTRPLFTTGAPPERDESLGTTNGPH